MAKTFCLFLFAAAMLPLHQACDSAAQKEKSTALPTGAGSSDASQSRSARGDSLSPPVPQVVYEMPPMRGRLLAELVDCNKLAALLPESLPNMKRDDMLAESAVDDSVLVSMAAGSYADLDGNSIEIRITDSGDLQTFAGGTYAWLKSDIQTQTAAGYERTISFGGYRGFERYYDRDQSGEMYIAVGERFVVEVTGNGVLSEDLKKAAGQIDLHKLEAMHQ